MTFFKKTYSTKFKLTFIVLAGIAAMFFSVYIITTFIISKSYIDIERNETIKNINRADDSLKNIMEQLTVKLTDWAYWDDTYRFVSDKNKEYIASNLGNSSISNLKINMMVFANTAGEVVFKKAVDYRGIKEISFEGMGGETVLQKKLLVASSKDVAVTGIVMLRGVPFIVSSMPILPSEATGEPRGRLIFGKYLDDEMVDSIGRLTYTLVNFYNIDAAFLPDDVSSAKSQLLGSGNTHLVVPISEDKIDGYEIVSDIYGKQVLIMKIETSREMYNQGLATLSQFLFTVGFFIILFGLVLIVLLQKFVFSGLVAQGGGVEKTDSTEKADAVNLDL